MGDRLSVRLEQALKYQIKSLQGVSRSFALTIPLLPAALRTVVTNAYLLCRVADTIEDDLNLSPDEVRHFQSEFIQVLQTQGEVTSLVEQLVPRLSEATLDAEKELVSNLDQVVLVTNSFNPGKREVLIRCVKVMCEQMPDFQRSNQVGGLETMRDMNHYCYAVAGVVGEMLTELFCNYSDEVALRSKQLVRLAPSFGQGLQMTNILKDVWDDWNDGNCWLPADVFNEAGYDLSLMAPDYHKEEFKVGIEALVATAHGHLRNALAYALLIPSNEIGIRKFLLWNINMAVATIRRVAMTQGYTSGNEVKISKGELLKIIALTNLSIRSDKMLTHLFDSLAKPVPFLPIDENYFDQAASLSSF